VKAVKIVNAYLGKRFRREAVKGWNADRPHLTPLIRGQNAPSKELNTAVLTENIVPDLAWQVIDGIFLALRVEEIIFLKKNAPPAFLHADRAIASMRSGGHIEEGFVSDLPAIAPACIFLNSHAPMLARFQKNLTPI
jgi:hypothetical protein